MKTLMIAFLRCPNGNETKLMQPWKYKQVAITIKRNHGTAIPYLCEMIKESPQIVIKNEPNKILMLVDTSRA